MMKINYSKLKQANTKALKGLLDIFPIIISVLLLISIATILIPKSFYSQLFTHNIFFDSIIGSLLGSILAGNPITGYISGNEFLKNGVSLVAITAFIVAWTTVGVIQYPTESIILGKRFAISRNLVAFFMAILTAIITVTIIQIL